MAERPKVEIIFKQLAGTLIKRTGESVVVLLLSRYDAEAISSGVTAECFETVDMIKGVSKEELTGKTLTPSVAASAIKYCMATSPKKIILSNLGWEKTWNKLKSTGETNCIVASADQGAGGDSVGTAIIALAKEGYGCNFVVQNDEPTLHSTHYHALAGNKYVTYYDADDLIIDDYELQGLYAGAIASCGTDRSLTNYTLPLVKNVVAEDSLVGTDLTAKGIIYAEMVAGKPRVVAGINTAEISDDVTEDMQHIEVVQTMDMMCKDIGDTFIEYYRGAYKNNYDRQLLLIAAINGYFRDLAKEEVLDPEYDNVCEIDIDTQRNAWIDKGKSEAESWSDDKVKLMSFGRKVFLKANVKICQSMEDLEMYITLE